MAAIHFKTLSLGRLLTLNLPARDDAHCYIWTVNSMIEITYALARAWGFRPTRMLYWIKQPMGIGLGGTFAGCVEPILFCTRGSLPAKRRVDRNWWLWKRRPHCAKPEAFQDLVETVSPGPYLEVFARRKRPGWSVWGNEVEPEALIPPL